MLLDSEMENGWWPGAGPKISPEWMRAIAPLPVAPEVGLCGTACLLEDACHRAGPLRPSLLWLYEEHRKLALRSGIRAAWSDSS